MKKLLQVATILGAVTIMGCGQSKSGSTEPTPTAATTPSGYASTPQPCNNQNTPWQTQGTANCQNNPAIQTQNWQWQNGAWIWPNQYNIQAGNCGCPQGYFPVSTNQYGTACAPLQYRDYGLVRFQFGIGYQTPYYNPYQNQSNQYWNQPQNGGYINHQLEYYQNADLVFNCQRSTAQGCDVRQNTCPQGSQCIPVAGGSTIGLCSR